MQSQLLKILLGLFLFGFIQLKAKAQYPSDKEVFFDSLQIFWADINKSGKAALWALEFKNKWPNSFNTRIEKSLVPVLISTKNTKAETAFLENLYLKNDSAINAFITPIYYWNKIQNTNNETELNALVKEFTSLIKDSANYLNRTERYALMVVRNLEMKNQIDKEVINKLFNKIIANLEKFRYLDRTDAVPGSMQHWQRHWFRCLYSYTYYQKYLKDPQTEINIEKAACFSPDFIDLPFESLIKTELSNLYGATTIPNYNIVYFNFLEKNHKELKALKFITKLTLREPTNDNLSLLKKSYAQNRLIETFQDYWAKKVDSIMKPFPKLKIEFNNGKTVDFGKASKNWVYMDVWATWCSPCVKELPEIEKFYQSLKGNKSLKLYTLSFNSTDLKNFIAKNKYTFPVSEIKEDVTKQLGVSAYPTKFLVSPGNKYLEIPHGNWQEYIKNYMNVE